MILKNDMCRRSSFTMIELLLVVVIIGIASAVAIPSFVSSFSGAKLRSATRMIAMTSRFARSTAVLQQKDVALIFYPGRDELEMVSIQDGVGVSERERFLDARADRAVVGLLNEDEEIHPDAPLPTIESELVRPLPEGVHILDVEVNGQVIEIEDSYLVNFYRNGMSDPFSMRITDESDRLARVMIDPLSGKVTVSRGQ